MSDSKRRVRQAAVFVSGIALGAVVTGSLWTAFSLGREPLRYCGPDGLLRARPAEQEERSYCLLSNVADALQVGEPFTYTFSVVDDRGTTVTAFEKHEERQLHLVVVREDLQYFQHVHPELNAVTGEFRQSLQFGAPGVYRLFADLAPEDSQAAVTAVDRITVGSKGYTSVPLEPHDQDAVQDYQVQLTTSPEQPSVDGETSLLFTLTRNGQPLTGVGKFLGTYGHAIVIREGTYEYAHAHPVGLVAPNQVQLNHHFGTPGVYKIFAQFQHEGRVITTDFVLRVR